MHNPDEEKLPGVPQELFRDLKWCAEDEDNTLDITGEDARHILSAINRGRKLARNGKKPITTHRRRHPAR